ncbi:5'-nucleotidase, lipoprotein e(P4) family [Limosilactobacillus ingluviei]|uniref:Lipoprotein e(P4) family acid phosphatasE5-nucleotidase n=1 Tax=Limosilactobacillus ingluviei TaxID=148604 RepID=A0A0R2GTA4_9LACO|nr:5'-nucleotidase, lipoprotein e(P4) family [Limosilactobacillus ingluviei]KRN43662.1 lipoprotein e(P4) family acid phosphatasE5-nucleotidase [Limosilactobacillus ingluviei]
MKSVKRRFAALGVVALMASGSLASVAQPVSAASTDLGNQNTMAVAWYQTSAEAKALYLQGYNDARENLDQSLTQQSSKPRAIILDIDETVLDNSPYQAYNALHNKSFPTGWNDWVKAAKAKPVPGAKDFLNYANQKGIEIYYVSDRSVDQLKPTIKNLKNEGLPQADDQHVLLKSKSDKTKEARRQKVEANHNVIMLFGDNLSDFNDPKQSTVKGRYNDVMKNASQFGTKYIILPNPMYGGWEGALYNNNYNQSKDKLSKARKAHLTYFNPQTNKVQNTTITEK